MRLWPGASVKRVGSFHWAPPSSSPSGQRRRWRRSSRKALRGLLARARLGNHRLAARFADRGDRDIGLQRRLTFGQDKKRGTGTVQPGDLHIARIAADIGIGEARLRMGLLQRAAGDDVVEHHRQAQATDLNRSVGGVGQREAQGGSALVVHPFADDSKRQAHAQRSTDVRRRKDGTPHGRGAPAVAHARTNSPAMRHQPAAVANGCRPDGCNHCPHVPWRDRSAGSRNSAWRPGKGRGRSDWRDRGSAGTRLPESARMTRFCEPLAVFRAVGPFAPCTLAAIERRASVTGKRRVRRWRMTIEFLTSGSSSADHRN